jgi:hypothetical protein
MNTRLRSVLCAVVAMLAAGASDLAAQDATTNTARDAARARREARREQAEERAGQKQVGGGNAVAERVRVEGALRQALARAVRERLSLNDQQATRLMDVNRKFSEDRIKLTRDEMRIRRELRQSVASGDSTRSPGTARLLNELLAAQRQRLELQQQEQDELSQFLTPEQRVKYIGMMEQLRRRIQQRADSARSAGGPPEE